MAEKKAAPKKSAAGKAAKTRAPKANNQGRGKKYVEAAKKVEMDKLYALDEALALVRETSTTKFDGTVESHWNLGIDTKGGEQNIRAAISLPHGKQYCDHFLRKPDHQEGVSGHVGKEAP